MGQTCAYRLLKEKLMKVFNIETDDLKMVIDVAIGTFILTSNLVGNRSTFGFYIFDFF